MSQKQEKSVNEGDLDLFKILSYIEDIRGQILKNTENKDNTDNVVMKLDLLKSYVNSKLPIETDLKNDSKLAIESANKNIENTYQKQNPTQVIYQSLGEKLTTGDDDDELKPVRAISENANFILDMFQNKMVVGEYLTDISMLKNKQSFIVISNHIHSSLLAGMVTKYSTLDNFPFTPANYLSPGYGLVNTMAVKNDKIEDDSEILFVGFDSGNVIALNSNISVLATKQYCHNSVTKIQLNSKQDKFICADLDGRIVIVDCQEMVSLGYYNMHSDAVNDLSYKPNDDNILATASSDNNIFIWDLRAWNHPANDLTSLPTKPTALDWYGENEITFGTECGTVATFDIRNRNTVKSIPLLSMETKMESFNSERDHSIEQIRPIFNGKYVAILCDNYHWIYDRKLKKRIQCQLYPQDIKIKNCIDLNDSLLTIGNKFGLFTFKNFL